MKKICVRVLFLLFLLIFETNNTFAIPWRTAKTRFYPELNGFEIYLNEGDTYDEGFMEQRALNSDDDEIIFQKQFDYTKKETLQKFNIKEIPYNIIMHLELYRTFNGINIYIVNDTEPSIRKNLHLRGTAGDYGYITLYIDGNTGNIYGRNYIGTFMQIPEINRLSWEKINIFSDNKENYFTPFAPDIKYAFLVNCNHDFDAIDIETKVFEGEKTKELLAQNTQKFLKQNIYPIQNPDAPQTFTATCDIKDSSYKVEINKDSTIKISKDNIVIVNNLKLYSNEHLFEHIRYKSNDIVYLQWSIKDDRFIRHNIATSKEKPIINHTDDVIVKLRKDADYNNLDEF